MNGGFYRIHLLEVGRPSNHRGRIGLLQMEAHQVGILHLKVFRITPPTA